MTHKISYAEVAYDCMILQELLTWNVNSISRDNTGKITFIPLKKNFYCVISFIYHK